MPRSKSRHRSKNLSRKKTQSRRKRSKSKHHKKRSKSAKRKAEQKYELTPISDYTSVKKIGEGENGKVYLLCEGRKCVVRKMIKLDYDYLEPFNHEVEMQKKFAKAHLAPKLYGYGVITKGKSKYAVLDMEQISGTFDDLIQVPQSKETLDWIVSSVNKILRKMCKHGLIHGDAHLGNFAYKDLPHSKRKALLIDFGLSCCIKKAECNERLEYIKLLESLDTRNQNNLNYLKKQFQSIYNKRFGSDPRTDREIGRIYDVQFQDDFRP
jgi:tRNA A-37 threonylcarbamoyl transferase component Bud32